MLCGLAWAYLLHGPALDMPVADRPGLVLFPHAAGARMGAMEGTGGSLLPPWGLGQFGLLVAMWWAMMVAMMAPSATPAILLYASVFRHAADRRSVRPGLAPTGTFTLGYLLAWLSFSLVAAALQGWLARQGAMSTMMSSQSRWLSAGILALAGLYQLSGLKRRCLANCRAPAAFLSRHWRPGIGGALRLGALHGAFCVGCCWALMALLFVGGVMNVVWIAALTLLVAAEKLVPAGERIGRVAGLVLLVWAVATTIVA